ncbi:MAG: hypothetical protein HQ475_07870 [SAR202 cluster bacterium]|nr:hypothetical protein [SAR202 cluster bacterium]
MWPGPTFQTYYLHISTSVREYLDKQDPSYLLSVDFEEYLDYLESEFIWDTQDWYIDQLTADPYVTKERRLGRGGRQINTEEHRIRLRIPLGPHPQRKDYFNFGPSTTRGAQPDFKFDGDTLILDVEATEAAVQRGQEDVNFWLGNRNKDIEKGNKNLRAQIKGVWEVKRKQIDEGFGTTNEVLKNLNLPIHQDPNAKAKPVEIKRRVLRTVLEKPSSSTRSEQTLSREDVIGLIDFVEQYVRQFETSPKAYSEMGEEHLRDILAGMINANYPGSTTGETFSKLGKTDISFKVDSGHVLICECKFWTGAHAYGEAIDQLFRYLTWRQNYGVLIHFSKLKELTRAISEASRGISEQETYSAGSLSNQGETRLTSRHVHPQDSEKTVEIFHLFVDLSF